MMTTRDVLPRSVSDEVEQECLILLARSLRGVRLGSYLALGFISAVGLLWSPWGRVGVWLAIKSALNTVLLVMARRVLRAPSPAAVTRWHQRDVALHFVQGIGWGSTALLFIPDGNTAALAAVCCCLCAVAYDSAARSAHSPTQFLVWAGAIMATLSIYFVQHLDTTHLLIGVGASFAFLGSVLTNRDLGRLAREGVEARFAKETALRDVERERADAEEARARAEQANLAKSQFLAAASHDLRQPLYALGLFSASLDTLRLDAAARSVVAGINDSVRVMETLFDNLLDLSKLEAGVVVPAIEPVQVAAVFDELSQIFRPMAVERGLDLRFAVDDEVVASDPALLKQVLSNLIANALRATTTGGVLVLARKRRGSVRLEVWDTGVGIAPDKLTLIFEEFVQLGNPERDRRKGLGLGLAIARRAARLLASDIEVASRFGIGSRFALSQRAVAGISPVRPVAATVPAMRRPGLPVLVVEDELDVRLALADLLRRWQIPFEAVADSHSASVVADRSRVGLVLADYRLGRSDGLAIIADLRRRDAGVPAALITADFDPALIARARDAGVPLFHKPLRPDVLRRLVDAKADSPAPMPIATVPVP